MFLYPALAAGFAFLAVPPLVHLINLLRHRRRPWAAMDFLLASYRKQRKWVRLRQLLLLLSRIAVAALLVAMLAGWTGGGQVFALLGGATSHHVFVLDDSYSMGDRSGGGRVDGDAASGAHRRALRSLENLTRRLGDGDGAHQLTVIRGSRAVLARDAAGEGFDAADLSSVTVTPDARLINRLMATDASPLAIDLVPALDLAASLIDATPADSTYLYVASDYRRRDWAAADRIAESMRRLPSDTEVRLIDCAADTPGPNLSLTALAPRPDVWVAGVPVVIEATIKNESSRPVSNVNLTGRTILYDADAVPDPTRLVSGDVEPLPAMVIESIAAGEEVTKSFQVFINRPGTHAIELELPDDVLPIDNARRCTLPLSDAERVLIVDGDVDGLGAYHLSTVLDPGGGVRVGAVPDVRPPGFLRSVTVETLSTYRAVYLVDLPEINESAAAALQGYVEAGGGLAWFLGDDVSASNYNSVLIGSGRRLLPAELEEIRPIADRGDDASSRSDVRFAESGKLLEPLRDLGDSAFGLLTLQRSWTLRRPNVASDRPSEDGPVSDDVGDRGESTFRPALLRRDGQPLVTSHDVGRGQVITVLTGLAGKQNNWPSDPTFVVFVLEANAILWSGAAPPTSRQVDAPVVKSIPRSQFGGAAEYMPAAIAPPRVLIEIATREDADSSKLPLVTLRIDPSELVVEGEQSVAEILRPGLAEWAIVGGDGDVRVTPVASVIRAGESDLSRVKPGEITQQLLPTSVSFVSSDVWDQQNRVAGGSRLAMVLLGLLASFLAAEQLLARWASYHVNPTAKSKRRFGFRRRTVEATA